MYVTLNLNIMADNANGKITKDLIDNLVSKLVPGELIDENVVRFTAEALNAIQIYARKNHDYGNSFEDGMDLIGDAYGTGRIYDKAKRLATLTKKPDNAHVEESMQDTAIDLACYGIMFCSYKDRILLRNTFKLNIK